MSGAETLQTYTRYTKCSNVRVIWNDFMHVRQLLDRVAPAVDQGEAGHSGTSLWIGNL